MTKAMCQGMSYLGAREIEGPWPLSPQLQRERSPWVLTPLSGVLSSAVPSKGLSQCAYGSRGTSITPVSY